VLAVDRQANRLSLGLKPSYFVDQGSGDDGEEMGGGEEADFDDDLEAAMEVEGSENEEEGGSDEEDEEEGSDEKDFDLDEELAEIAEDGDDDE
jgi:hypothetical protein